MSRPNHWFPDFGDVQTPSVKAIVSTRSRPNTLSDHIAQVALDPRIHQHAPFDLRDEARVIVAATVGSASHGTYVPAHEQPGDPMATDDVDILGAILPPAPAIIGLDRWTHWTMQEDELDVVFYSLHRLVELLLKSNPNVLGLLWLRDEDYLVKSPEWQRFVDTRDAFSSKQIHRAFTGYAMSQLRDIDKGVYEGYMGTKRKALVDTFGYDVKHASHLIRLLRMGTEFLRTGYLRVYRDADGDVIRAIKRGEWTLDQVQVEAAVLFAEADVLIEKTKLPDQPDREKIQNLLVDITHEWLVQR